jgi:hypothetical protein
MAKGIPSTVIHIRSKAIPERIKAPSLGENRFREK